jgi:hypothetical protein
VTAVLDEAPPERFGATAARVFTPPLEHHIDPETGDLDPQYSWGPDCIDFLENVLHWELLPYQRWLYIHALEKGVAGQGFRFQTLVVLIARQNGKTKWLKGLTLWRLYLNKKGVATPFRPAAQLALIAMQGLDFAEKMLADVNDDIKKCPPLRKEWQRHWTANGKHRIQLRGRREWRATTANRKGGRSFSVDHVNLDELREHHNWLAWNAIVPTSITRSFSLVCCFSNAGDNTSIVLRSLRDSAVKRISTGTTVKARTFYAEWSVPMDVDPKNAHYWYLANPAMGHLSGLQIEDLEGALENMEFTNMPGFQTEHLCQWVDALDPGIIPAEHWQETMDNKSEIPKGVPVYAAVDVNFQRSKAYVAVAGRRKDGHLHTEVVMAGRGTDWIIPWFLENVPGTKTPRKDSFVAVAVQARGAPASNLIKGMVEAGITVAEWGGPDLYQGCGSFFDKIVRHTVFHRPAATLDRAAAATTAKTIADAWVFDRRNSPVDAAPLIACAAAAWAEEMGPPETDPVPETHSWDVNEIASWEAQARKGELQ